MIFDTHAHYNDTAFDEDRDALLGGMLEAAGIGHVIDVGASPEDLADVKSIADRYDYIYGALGVHPDEAGRMGDETLSFIREALQKDPKIVAVGEIGFDYHNDVEPHEVQRHWFSEQIDLAIETGVPVIIHSRNAAEDTMELIREKYGPGTAGAALPEKGIIHCYSYSAEQALQYRELGFFIGVGGVVTFKNGKKLKKVVETLPLSSIVLETDCPYLAPEPHRGERNSSLFLPYVVRTIAAEKGVSEEEVEQVTWDNAVRLFGVDN